MYAGLLFHLNRDRIGVSATDRVHRQP